ncbi:MAG: hypothetical protein HY543_06155 [Deltaproteobacteria bacterium]|nr:hypothetical protein [Deltaproteobacteria bacterium]
MQLQPFTATSWPRAILHVRADRFCAGVEQARHPDLRGKPVVTGAERGCVISASTEAAACGVRPGLSLTEAAHLCPDLLMLPGDAAAYREASDRLFALLRRFSTRVEAVALADGFADLSGFARERRTPIPLLAKEIQDALQDAFGLDIAIGCSLSKTLARLCSRYRAPRGCTILPGHSIHALLDRIGIASIEGLAPALLEGLRGHGYRTVLDFARQPRYVAEDLCGPHGVALWSELRGECCSRVLPVPSPSRMEQRPSPRRANRDAAALLH